MHQVASRSAMPIMLLISCVAGCSSARTNTPATVQAAPPASTVTTSPEASARARADSVRRPYTEADVHFMSGMIGHHAQALVMAGWAPTHGASGPVRRLCERILNGQQDEIITMQQWLADREKPVPPADPAGMSMVTNGVEHTMRMPGMLTDEQMKQLDAARGAGFDRLFLTFMIQHHKGAVAMVKQLFSTYGAAQDQTVFKFASDVNVDQSTEIARMEKMLATVAN